MRKTVCRMIYLMAAMQPMAIGAFVVPILSRKFSARRILQISCVITVVGVGIALINPYNFGIAVLGGLGIGGRHFRGNERCTAIFMQ